MTARDLFHRVTSFSKKQQILIKYANWLSIQLNRPLTQDDFKVRGRITANTASSYFNNSLTTLFEKCDFDTSHRKKNMSCEELREFLISIKRNKNGCWVTDYYRARGSGGRQRIKYKGKLEALYRVSYTLFKRPIPPKYLVLHSCDNPVCYNPDHLKVGSSRDNVLDAVAKGRWQVARPKKRKAHGIKDPYDKVSLIMFAKYHSRITDKNEWLFMDGLLKDDYPSIHINGKKYLLHRLLLANKLNKQYEMLEIARHRLSDGSKPNKHDVNPEHLIEGSRRANSLDTVNYNKSYKLSFKIAKLIRDAADKEDFSKVSKTLFDKKWAAKLDLHEATISAVRRGKSWNDTY